jgi:hypothetical protein
MDQDVFRVTPSVIIAVAAAEHEAEAAMATDDVPLLIETIRAASRRRRCPGPRGGARSPMRVCTKRSVVALLCAR